MWTEGNANENEGDKTSGGRPEMHQCGRDFVCKLNRSEIHLLL